VQIVILEEAAAEILAAHDWYESRRRGLGFDFEVCVEAALDRIALFPESFPIKYRTVRRSLIPHFPYGVYFTVAKETVFVIALFHFKRNPKTLQSSIARHLKDRL
jgi:hypothetical protein